MADITRNRDAARAVGRCSGAMFFSIFGGLWLLLAAYAWGHLSRLGTVLIALAVVLFLIKAWRIQQRGKEAAIGAYPEAERRRNDRIFGWINFATWISVALVFQIMPRLGHPELDFPAVAFIVGLHFFPMPPLYQHHSNLVIGAFLIGWAIFCPLILHGDHMIGLVAFGSGLALWAGAAWALNTASHLLAAAGL